MPYSSNSELPSGVRKIPAAAQTIFRKAFNAALSEYGSEETAAKVAWAAVKRKYRKSGDRWVLKESDTSGEAIMDPMVLSLDHPPELLETIEEDGQKIMRYRGCATRDNCISSNRYYYDRSGNDELMERTNEFMKSGRPVTVYARHEKAMFGLPVGKVDKPLYREGNEILYEARIIPTTEGLDVQRLIQEGVLSGSSIRARKYEVKPMKVDNEQVMAVKWAIVNGIDLTDAPSIAGAGIRDVLAESIIEEVDTPMEWDKLTIDDLRANRPDLLEDMNPPKQSKFENQMRAMQEELDKAKTDLKVLTDGQATAIQVAVDAAKTPLLEQINDLMTNVTESKLGDAIARAIANQPEPLRPLVESALRNGLCYGDKAVSACTKAEDVTPELLGNVQTILESIKQAVLTESAQKDGDSFKGDVHDRGGSPNDYKERIKKLAS